MQRTIPWLPNVHDSAEMNGVMPTPSADRALMIATAYDKHRSEFVDGFTPVVIAGQGAIELR